MQSTQLALYPLPSHILPDGKLPLRIIEERYIRMIKESAKAMTGFGIAMIDNQKSGPFGRISPIGTHVKIVDFYSLDDGFLGIIIEGIDRFVIDAIIIEEDGLKVADIHYISNWPAQDIIEQDRYLTDKLTDIFEQHPELNELYTSKEMDNASWISQRWLELLPIPVEQKQQLLQQPNCARTLQVIKELIPM
ncbi:LON peptidase substrate-binding domain-containing protein [Moritella sp. 24]|uniref:LON peptidase substrate-binding domain-containing protein n=1 Tax=Moritella sp. 24 TaxID=2746230 RepID=UPI001BA72E68|nr:LON peptidase substrate-binding domain-containing protein [Moritella sp. 24]QUM76406.1 LON peptidase substrate-binding domain-containing protein [Moritella sp. 24]